MRLPVIAPRRSLALALAAGVGLGPASALADGPSYLSCVADTDSKVLVWKAEEAARFWDQHPEVGYQVVTNIARLLYQRLRHLNQVILDRVAWGLE